MHPEPSTPFPDIKRPTICNQANQALADYLWENSLDFYWGQRMGKAWAWRRAAETVCATPYMVQLCLLDLGNTNTRKLFPYIGEKMSDVIREFYIYYHDEWTSTEYASEEVSLPNVCPTATMEEEDEQEWQQGLLNFLWDNDYRELAAEIAEKEALPETRADFETFDNCCPEALQDIFTRNTNIPAARNWCNANLVEWLWKCGNECPGPAATSYYNAARGVARKTTAVTPESLEEIKYIGPHIATRARGEMAGIVDPTEYRNLRKELNRLRRQEADLLGPPPCKRQCVR